MGCKPSKETLRATTSADEERRSRTPSRINQNEEIEKDIDQQQIIRLAESDNEEEDLPLSIELSEEDYEPSIEESDSIPSNESR